MSQLENNFVLILITCFLVKHFICDFPLQNIFDNWIIKNKGSRDSGEWVPPLITHVTIHAIVSFLILFLIFVQFDSKFLVQNAIWQKIALVTFLELVAHFVIDRLKADPDIGGRFKPDQIYFWWALGLDQLAHYLTYVVMIVILIN